MGFASARAAIDAAQNNLSDMVQNLIAFWVEQGQCFTSGHVVSAIRSARPDMVFRQVTVGQMIRDSYLSDTMPRYDNGLGVLNPVLMVPRRTVRTDTRTPVGTEVWVYGPIFMEAYAFEFEINIETAAPVSDGQGGMTSATNALLSATPGLPPGAPGASPIPPVTPSGTVAEAKGLQAPMGPVRAVVHADGRLCIPRGAFEALAYHTGESVVGGTVMFLDQTPGRVVLHRQQTDPNRQVEVRVTTDRLRAHITLDPGNVRDIGTAMDVLVMGDSLLVDL